MSLTTNIEKVRYSDIDQPNIRGRKGVKPSKLGKFHFPTSYIGTILKFGTHATNDKCRESKIFRYRSTKYKGSKGVKRSKHGTS